MSTTDPTPPNAAIIARRREIAIEHLLFGTIRFVAERHPDLIATLETSVDHLWDIAHDGSRDDEAVRDVARQFLKSLRSEQGRG